jgi:hypothetical protein
MPSLFSSRELQQHSECGVELFTQTKRFSHREERLADAFFRRCMANPVGESLDLMLTHSLAKVGEAVFEARERNPVLESGWSVQACKRVAGQREVGQAHKHQMPVDSVPAKHLVLAQSYSAQLLEQDFDRPASFVSLDDLTALRPVSLVATASRFLQLSRGRLENTIRTGPIDFSRPSTEATRMRRPPRSRFSRTVRPRCLRIPGPAVSATRSFAVPCG